VQVRGRHYGIRRNKKESNMTVTTTVTFTDAQYHALSVHDLADECLRVDVAVYVYTADDTDVILWVIQQHGSIHQERLINNEWIRFEYDETTGEWNEED
jgi:hypothetical protein